MSRSEDIDKLHSLVKFGELLDREMNEILFESNWSIVPKICDFVLQNDVEPQLVFTTIKTKITNYQHIVLYAFSMQIVEELGQRAQNCGTLAHDEVTSKQYMEQLKELNKTAQYYANTTLTSPNVIPSDEDKVTCSKSISPQSFFAVEASASFNNSGLKDIMTHALISVICKDNMPIKTVESESFVHFVKTLCPTYKVPSTPALTTLIEKRYDICKSYLKRLLDQANYVSLTANTYTCKIMNSTRSYLMINCHFINLKSSKLETYCLKVAHLSESRLKKNIDQAFNKIFEEFISISRVAYITAGAPNMQKAINPFLHALPSVLWCFVYLTNTVVQNSLDKTREIREIILIIRNIIAYFEDDTTASDTLRAEQLKNGTSEDDILYLTQDVPTQWNSTLEMMEKFVKLAPILKTILTNECNKDGPQMMDQSEIEVIHDVINLLAPLKEATTEISANKYITGSIVLPLCYNVEETLNELQPTTCFAKGLKENLLKEIEIKYDSLRSNMPFIIATLLDPRFKKIYSFRLILENNAISQVSQEIKDIENQQNFSPVSEWSPSKLPQKDSHSIWVKYTERVQRLSDEKGMYTEYTPLELKLYLNSDVLPLSEDPVSYWLNCKTYPVLAQVALKYCTIMGSSIAPKKILSVLNNAVSSEQNTSSHINKAAFLAHFTENMFTQ